MEKQLQPYKHKRWPAIRGNSLSLHELVRNNIITPQGAKDAMKPIEEKTFGLTLTYGAVGCALSHVNIWRKARESRKLTLVLEDDVILSDFDRFPKCMQNLPRDWDIFYLGSGHYTKKLPQNEDDKQGQSHGISCIKHAYGTFGYVINPKSANKLLSITPIRNQIDSEIRKLNLRMYIIEPPLVIPRRDMKSDIQIRDGHLTPVQRWKRSGQRVYR